MKFQVSGPPAVLRRIVPERNFRNPDLWENEVAPLQPVEAAQPSLVPGKFSHVDRPNRRN